MDHDESTARPPRWREPAQSAEPDASGWVTCPGCAFRFSSSDSVAWTGRRHRRCGQRIDLAGQPSEVKPIWCVVGNVVDVRTHGPGGLTRSPGTAHFAPGTKLYCFPPLWGDGYTDIKVVGRHRGSRRYVTMVVRSAWLRSWRAQLVYSPTLIDLLSEQWNGSEDARKRAEDLAEGMNERQRA